MESAEDLKVQIALLEWRAKRAEDFLDDYGAAPTTAKRVLAGDYDYEFGSSAPNQ